jgi:transcriptional regulator of arginine metabolism
MDERGERMTKNQRQHRIGELLEREVISTAAQLVTRLQAEDIVATQATVTRDLQELGTIKVRDEHGSRRIVIAMAPKMTAAPLDHLRRMMGEWVVSVDCSENLVVLRTPPGCAHVVASALDRSVLDGVLGSVAGDDTVLVIASEARSGASLAQEFRMLAGFAEPLVAFKKGK